MPHYSHAPIKEAILDIHVAGGQSSALEVDDGMHEIRETYSQRKELSSGPRFELTAEPEKPPSFHFGSSLHGFRYLDAEGTRIVQTRVGGFSFNQLAPYDTWETFSAEARRLWEIFVRARKPQFITRIGLRYINHIALPAQMLPDAVQINVDITDYFALYPQIPGAIPGAIEGHTMQLAMLQPDLQATLLLHQSTIDITPQNELLMLLDIDLYRDSLRWNPHDADQLWNYAAQLRNRKNQVFESCLQAPLKELIR